MKRIILHIAILLLSSATLFSQEPARQISPVKQEKPCISEQDTATAKSLIDDSDKKNLNKLQDEQASKHQKNRMKNHFIDKDGDGINDNRCNGFGVGKSKQQGRKRGKK